MARIKLIDENTDFSRLEMSKLLWDVEINGNPYQVVKIKGYIHSIGGEHGQNDLWMYPRFGEPTYDNILEYNCSGCGVCWGIRYAPYNYGRSKFGEAECFTTGGATITRNDKDFYFCRGGIEEAQYKTKLLQGHPLSLWEYGFISKAIGRKVWYRSEPAIITHWVDKQACVILEPDSIGKFSIPAEFADEGCYDEEYQKSVKIDILDENIWWFRS